MQPDNVLMGDATGIDLPQKPVDQTALDELRNKAKYSRSQEYKDLKAKADERIEFYKAVLPAGYAEADKQRKAEMWGFANLIIAEFQQLFGEHENASQMLKEELGE